jgi:hypothetical protein
MATLPNKVGKKTGVKKTKKPALLSVHTGPVKARPIASLVAAEITQNKATAEQLELLRNQMADRAKQNKENLRIIPGPSTPAQSAAATAPSSAHTTPLGSPKWTSIKGNPKNASPNTGSPSLIAALQDSLSKPSTPRHSPRLHAASIDTMPTFTLEAPVKSADKKAST